MCFQVYSDVNVSAIAKRFSSVSSLFVRINESISISWLVKFSCKILHPRHTELHFPALAHIETFSFTMFPTRGLSITLCKFSFTLYTNCLSHLVADVTSGRTWKWNFNWFSSQSHTSCRSTFPFVSSSAQTFWIVHFARNRRWSARYCWRSFVIAEGKYFLCSDKKLFSDWTIERRTFFMETSTRYFMKFQK